jgi:stage II sporulation protein D
MLRAGERFDLRLVLMKAAVLGRAEVLRAVTALSLCAVLLAVAAGSGRAVGVFQVRGGGYGHGVGMSQYGADGYAQRGKGYAFILRHYYEHSRLGTTDPEQTIKVLLSATGEPTFSGAYSAGSAIVDPGVSYTVRPNADGTLTLLYRGYVRKKHRRVPATKTVGPLGAPLDVVGDGALRLAGKGRYDGTLTFRPAGASNVQTVEALGLDDYVSGVVPSEVPSDWPAQALEAQAVAARTFAITADAGGGRYNVFDDTRSQAYGGVDVETAATNAAVDTTSGQIVTYRGQPAITYFFSSSGGHTESIENVWPSTSAEPWLVGVPDPFDAADGQDPYHRVVHTMSIRAAAAKLRGLYRGAFEGVRVLRHGLSPRVIAAEVVGSRGADQTTGAVLQKRLGLLTDWEVFDALSADAGAAPGGDGGTAAAQAARAARNAGVTAGEAQTQAMTAIVPLVDTMLVQAIPGLHGTLIPARPGARLAVQLRVRRGWTDGRAARGRRRGALRPGAPGAGHVPRHRRPADDAGAKRPLTPSILRRRCEAGAPNLGGCPARCSPSMPRSSSTAPTTRSPTRSRAPTGSRSTRSWARPTCCCGRRPSTRPARSCCASGPRRRTTGCSCTPRITQRARRCPTGSAGSSRRRPRSSRASAGRRRAARASRPTTCSGRWPCWRGPPAGAP